MQWSNAHSVACEWVEHARGKEKGGGDGEMRARVHYSIAGAAPNARCRAARAIEEKREAGRCVSSSGGQRGVFGMRVEQEVHQRGE